MELDYVLILLLCLCAASSLWRGGGRWCNGAVTSSSRDQWRRLMQRAVMQIPGDRWEKCWDWGGEE